MNPAYCQGYETSPKHRLMWDEGRFPGQTVVRQNPKKEDPPPGAGPGMELKRILRKFGIQPKGCACNRLAAEMDRRGVGWCRANIDKIASRMYEEARKRKFPLANLSRPAIKLLIRWAIRRSERRH